MAPRAFPKALTVAVAVLLVPLLAPTTASQAAGTSGKAKVVRVLDGDTIDVDRNFDGRIDARVRLIGLDAPERGLCGSSAATAALARLLGRKVVTLSSDSRPTGILNRLVRRVTVMVGGRKVDATTWMLERGWGVWMPRDGELTGSLAQHQAADRAAAAGIGWFDSDRCGLGPFNDNGLSMQVEYVSDAAGWMSPQQIRNQEFIRVRNDSSAPVSIDGWTLRVGNDRRRAVPAGGPIPPGQAVEIHVGSGTNTATDRYLGSGVPMMVNASVDGGKHLGSGSYLIDPNNDIRAHMTWPCTLGCEDPTGGALVISEVMYDPPGPDSVDLNAEYVAITNRGNVPVRTGDIVLEVAFYHYELPTDHFLEPGETMIVRGGKGEATRLNRHIGAVTAALVNEGGRVLLRTYDAIVVDCVAWGTGRCPAGS